MPTYRHPTKHDGDLDGMIQTLIEQHYPELAEAEVSVEVLFAHALKDKDGEPRGPALKHHGWPAAAVVKINSLKDRVEGKKDCTVTLDGDRWGDWTSAERLALLDHELTHLQVRRTEGMVQSDDYGRPKLKIRPHDWEFTGFSAIAERHGTDSFEVRQARQLADEYGQLLFNFMAQRQAV